jgi:hypothetical protein
LVKNKGDKKILLLRHNTLESNELSFRKQEFE